MKFSIPTNMNKLQPYFFTALLFFISSCSTTKMPQRDVFGYQIMGQFAKKMQKQGFHAVGTGIGEDKSAEKGTRKLNYLQLLFNVDEVLTIERGRELAVLSACEFLNIINSNEDSYKYFIEYPMTTKYICIIIGGEKHPDSCIESVHVSNGFVNYFSGDLTMPHFGRIYKETFEEAVRILNCDHEK